MSNINKKIILWYQSKNKVKRFISRSLSHLFYLLFLPQKRVLDAKRRSYLMWEKGLIKHPTLVFLDMLFCYVFFGYTPIIYSSYCFQNLSLKQRLTFIPSYEHLLFAKSLNYGADENILSNKNKSYSFLKEFYARDRIIITSQNDINEFLDFISTHKKIFCKPLTNLSKDRTTIVNTEDIEPVDFFNALIKKGTFAIEELIVQCKELSSFHPSSVNTIRIVLFKTDNKIELLCGCLRCGRGDNIVDNGAAGSIFIPFNIENGRLLNTGMDENGIKYESHPDTDIRFNNFQIPHFKEIKTFAVAIARNLKDFKYLGLGIAVSEDKLMIVEARSNPWLITFEGLRKTGFKNEFRYIAKNRSIPDSYKIKQADNFNFS